MPFRSAEDEVGAVIDALEGADIPYALTGSLASNFHGVPRSTRDADIVVDLRAGALATLAEALAPLFVLDVQPSFETVTGTTRHVLRAVGSPFLVELFVVSVDPHDVARFARRIRVGALGRQVWVMTAEDAIVTKLRWAASGGRHKDLDDARGMLALGLGALDLEYVRSWCDVHGTRPLLEEVIAASPPR